MEQNNKKRDDNNDQRSQEGGSGDGMPRFNFMWIYILIGVGLLALQMTKFSGASKNATWADFERWSKKGHIQRLVVVNDKEAYVYIIADSLTASKEHEGIKPTKKTMFSSDQPQYVMNIGKVEVLEPKMAKLNEALLKEKKPAVIVEYDQRVNWSAVLITYGLPLLLFIGLWILIIRRVGGGAGGPGGQIFNIGKSKATLFDNTAKVNITFADVAGLDEARKK
jgi:AFG3 family protein